MAKLTERQMNIEGIHPIPSSALLAAKCARDGIAISSAIRAGVEFEDLLCIALEIKA